VKEPKPGDLVEVLIYEARPGGPKDSVWKSGVLLPFPAHLKFDDLLWVEVLIEGNKVMTSPNQVEIIRSNDVTSV
jgi:hypothetical protein